MYFYVYILRCADGTFYTGYTNDIHKRIDAHNAGKGAKYTRSRRPCKLVWAEAAETKSLAMKREYAIKQLTRKQKQTMLDAQPKNWPTLAGRLNQPLTSHYEALLQMRANGDVLSELVEEYLQKCCVFCHMTSNTRQHHIVPRAKGGTVTVPTCETCESYIHKTWNHNQLRDTFNSVESILAAEGFQRFLKWRKKQSPSALFKSERGKYRNKRPYS